MRTRSLFWTFAGVFLLVLAVATALQVVVSVGVLRPLQMQSVRDRVELALAHASEQLAALPDIRDNQAVTRVLLANRVEGSGVSLAFLGSDGHLVTEQSVQPALHQHIGMLLTGPGTSGVLPLPGPGNSSPPPPRAGDAGPPPPRPRDAGPPPPRPRDAEPRPAQAERAQPLEALQPEPRDLKLELLGRRPVAGPAGAVGEVAAIRARAQTNPWSLPESRALVLFLPFAVLAAGSAGLLMVRILVGRLRTLEQLATRVTEGDLTARVANPGPDEIGRLGERFNRMTGRLAAARTQLEDTDRQRRRLLADITHELATPLTSIRGYVETLLDPAVPTSQEERSTYLVDVLEEAKRLELLIGDLFDLARLEAGTTDLTLERLDWMALCRNTTRRYEPRFREARLGLQWTGPEGEAWVRADGRRLEQVVENLLGNALRYVPSGGNVWLALERVAAPAGGRYRLTLSDDGPGIAAEDLPHIFERFYRAAAVRSSSGTGLGLAIVQEIVRRHGGEVRAERREPRGSAFVVELPVLPT
jgi:two-component system, OmpR family, sensor histidine kinase BaeS